MHFRLFIATLEHFGDLFFKYRYHGISMDSDPITMVLLSVLTPSRWLLQYLF